MPWRILCIGIFFASATALAHLNRSTAVYLDLNESFVGVELHIPLEELEAETHLFLVFEPAQAVAEHRAQIEKHISESLFLIAESGKRWKTKIESLRVDSSDPNAIPILAVQLESSPPGGAIALDGQSTRNFLLQYHLIRGSASGHSALVSVRSDWRNAVFRGDPELVGTIREGAESLRIDRGEGSEWQGFRGVFVMGLRHIAEGTDHLLFLFMLLLPAPILAIGRGVKRHWSRYAGLKPTMLRIGAVVTAFTLGHSGTLLLGSLGWVHLPSQWVEVMIAVSVLISAIHAIRPLFAGREWIVAASFGLIHGLAFSNVIAELGLSSMRTAFAILGFNLGIEVMQLALVLVIVPWLILLSRTKFYPLMRVLGGFAGVIAAVFWILERTIGLRNPTTPTINQLTHHPVMAIVVLASLALLANISQGRAQSRG